MAKGPVGYTSIPVNETTLKSMGNWIIWVTCFNHWLLGYFNEIVDLEFHSVIKGSGISCDISCNGLSLDLTDDINSTFGSGNGLMSSGNKHYLNQYWPRSPTPYGVTRPQRVDALCGIHMHPQVSCTPWTLEITPNPKIPGNLISTRLILTAYVPTTSEQ